MCNNALKILISTAVFDTGGLGTYLENIAKGLNRRGWQIYFIITNGKGALFDNLSRTYRCYDLSSIPLSRKKIFFTADLVEKISPTIILLNHCSLMHYTLPLISNNIKPVAVLHSDDRRFFEVATRFNRRIFRWIAPSQKLVDQCKKYVSQTQYSNIRLIPHGVDSKFFYPCKDRDINKQQAIKKIAFVASLGIHKGADILPDIMQLIAGEYPNVHLYVIGDGYLHSSLENRFRELGLTDKCTFTGSVSHKVVAQYLQQSDIFLSPTNIEGFGLSIVEAMLSGAVPVVSRINGITDGIVDDGVTGFLTKTGDIRGFAEAIVRLLNNPEQLRAMSESSRSIAVNKYSQEKMLNSYEELFLEEDKREQIQCSGPLDWLKETSCEIIRRYTDGHLPFRYVFQLTKKYSMGILFEAFSKNKK